MTVTQNETELLPLHADLTKCKGERCAFKGDGGHVLLPVRPLSRIAREINNDPAYQKVAWCASPYLVPLFGIRALNEHYGHDTADNIVRYLLGNLGQYRGETARKVKAELRAQLALFDEARNR